MENNPIRPLSWTEKIKNVGYKFTFAFLSYIEEVSSLHIVPNHESHYLLGAVYHAAPETSKQVNQKIFEHFARTIWFTYRSIFPSLNQQGDGYITDTGWGCMVRVGQMFVAQSLCRHLRITEKADMHRIISLFTDYDEEAIFSIQNVVRIAKKDYDIEPGKWYNPSQIAYIMADLLRTLDAQNLPGCHDLDMVVLNNSTLFFDQIVFKMTGRTQLCKCKDKAKLVCHKCYKLQKSVSLVLLSRIGLEHPQKKYLRVVNRMMEFPHFQGILGGKPEKALYFIGRLGDNYAYLDPHTVQPGVSRSTLSQLYSSYFCTSFRRCRNSSIDPSIGMGFYIRDLKQLDNFFELVVKAKEDYPDDFFLFTSVDTPEYMKENVYPREKGELEASGFVNIDEAFGNKDQNQEEVIPQ